MIPEHLKNYMFNETDFFNEEYKCEDPEKEALVKELANMITDDIQIRKAEDVDVHYPDFWILDRLLTKEQVRFMLSFKKKRTVKLLPEQMAERNNMTPEEAERMAFDICEIGLMEFDRENPEGRRQYFIPKWVVGSGEYMMMTSRLLEKHPEVATFFNYASSVPVGKVARFVPPGGGGLGMHVIPVEKAIEHESRSVSVEHLSHWLKKYDKYCVDVCTCRRQQAMRGEGVGDIEGMMCLAVGDMAEYLVETRKDAHYITYDEVMNILKIAEEKGYVHQVTNLDGEDKIVGICNCSPGTCNALRTSQLFNTPNMSASAYRAHVDTEKCVACGKCVEVCPVGAAKLGQKLCLKDGSKIVYPKTELPDAQKWGPDKWNKNYREDAKINVYETGTAPCKTACPAHLAIQGYIKMASEGRYLDALKLIKQDNPFPAVCGAICKKYCEDECTRGTVDDALAIDDIKQFIAAQDLKAEHRYVPPMNSCTRKPFDQKIAIIGSGPAGMACAYFLAIEGYSPVVFEKAAVPGGMMVTGIPNFRLEKEVVNAEIDILREMGVQFRCGVEVGKDVTIQQLRDEGFQGFFVAVGLQYGGKLNIPGEDAEGVMAGVDYVKAVNAGTAAPLQGDVVVIGGGNIGADVARTAVRQGAASVKLYCLEDYEHMPMGAEDQALCREDGVEIHAAWGQTEIEVEDGRCAGIRFRRCLSVLNGEGRFDPKFDDSETTSEKCTTVLYCIGQKADWKDLLKDTKVEFNRNGTVITDPVTLQTGERDIFAGGDAVSGQKFVVDALAMGREGAVSLHRFVNEGQSLTIHRNTRRFTPLNKEDIVLPEEAYKKPARAVKGVDPAKKRTMHDERLVFTEEQIKSEASRCLSCGRSVVDTNKCLGCGMCTVQCKFDAIHLFRTKGDAYSKMIPAEDKFKAIGAYAAKRSIKIVKKKITGKSAT